MKGVIAYPTYVGKVYGMAPHNVRLSFIQAYFYITNNNVSLDKSIYDLLMNCMRHVSIKYDMGFCAHVASLVLQGIHKAYIKLFLYGLRVMWSYVISIF